MANSRPVSNIQSSSYLRRLVAAIVAASAWLVLGGMLAWSGYSDGLLRHVGWVFASPFVVAGWLAPEPAVIPVAFGLTVATFFVLASLAATARG